MPVRFRLPDRTRCSALSPPAFTALLMLVAAMVASPRAVAGPPLKSAELAEASDAGFIEVVLRTCPPGYDLAATGAEPEEDCALADDGIRFTLRDDDPATDDRDAETGQRKDGLVLFRNVPEGQYMLIQQVPDGIADVLVLSCQGFNTGPFVRVPLHEGPELNISAPANAPIMCTWLNIPQSDATPLASPVATPQGTPDVAG